MKCRRLMKKCSLVEDLMLSDFQSQVADIALSVFVNFPKRTSSDFPTHDNSCNSSVSKLSSVVVFIPLFWIRDNNLGLRLGLQNSSLK